MDTDKHGLKKRKSELRSNIRARLDKISAAGREAASLKIRAKLKERSFFQNAASILFFAPLPDEADIWPLIEKSLADGKIVALPFFDRDKKIYAARQIRNPADEIAPGKFGVREPSANCAEIPLDKIDLVLVPGVAFDLRGNRLGRGKGFYDRLLAEIRGVKCGVAFDEQIADEVPVENLDAPVDFILTPARCVKIAG
jgi:5-formyltetrahydrofolate cyclo-ligase